MTATPAHGHESPDGAVLTGGSRSASLWSAADVLVLVILITVSSAAVWPDLLVGGSYGDDGGIAEAAVRVLDGRLPHRDFEDPWTGGWSYASALLFHWFGAKLSVLRVPIFVAWLVGLVAAARLARRFLAPGLSLLAALCCAAWTLYAYHTPLLNGFYAPLALLACWGVARFDESRRPVWLVMAGASVGAALLVKISGLFALAALLLWCADEAGRRDPADPPARGPSYAWVLAVVLAAWGLAVLALLRGLPRPVFGSAAVHFLLPSLLLIVWMLRRAAREGRSARAGIQAMVHLVLFVALGVVVAVAPMLWYYATQDALTSLWVGVFIRPSVRLTTVVFGPPGRIVTAVALAAPAVMLVGLRYASARPVRFMAGWALLLGAGYGALAHLDAAGPWGIAALAIRAVPIVLPLAALLFDEPRNGSTRIAPLVLLLVAMTVTSQLLQVPFATIGYFLFAAPFGILATFALMPAALRPAATLFWGAFLIVASADHVPGSWKSGASGRFAMLPFERGGLRVPLLDSIGYARVASIMATRPSGPLFVLGDAPELPFLLERRNPSPLIFDVTDRAGRDPARMRALLERERVLTVAIRHQDDVREQLGAAQMEELRRLFPHTRPVWRFEIRWRDRAAGLPSAEPPPARERP